MTIYNEILTIITKGGFVIFCRNNGYKTRTFESPVGHTCIDTYRNNYGAIYWKKQALKALKLTNDDILMEIKGEKVMFRD